MNYKNLSYTISHVFLMLFMYLFIVHRYSKKKTAGICIFFVLDTEAYRLSEVRPLSRQSDVLCRCDDVSDFCDAVYGDIHCKAPGR